MFFYTNLNSRHGRRLAENVTFGWLATFQGKVLLFETNTFKKKNGWRFQWCNTWRCASLITLRKIYLFSSHRHCVLTHAVLIRLCSTVGELFYFPFRWFLLLEASLIPHKMRTKLVKQGKLRIQFPAPETVDLACFHRDFSFTHRN